MATVLRLEPTGKYTTSRGLMMSWSLHHNFWTTTVMKLPAENFPTVTLD